MRTQTDLGFVRQVLADADATTPYQAAKKHGVHHSTVSGWLQRRALEAPGWPTVADVAAWREDQEQHATRRRRNADQALEYRKRVYLNRGPIMVPARGVVRRLQALMALGWSQANIADELGVTKSRVGHMVTGQWKAFNPATAAAVSAVYERLCMTVPVDKAPTKRGEIRHHARTRRRAEALGYAPPLAWDDIDTDPAPWRPTGRRDDGVDESVVQRVLEGERLPTTKAERHVIMARWLATGRSETGLCDRMGWRCGRYLPERLGATG